jgi:hypothetical protein
MYRKTHLFLFNLGYQLLIISPFKPTTGDVSYIKNIVFLYTYHLKKYYTNKFKEKNV